jgi:hypothetical protein
MICYCLARGHFDLSPCVFYPEHVCEVMSLGAVVSNTATLGTASRLIGNHCSSYRAAPGRYSLSQSYIRIRCYFVLSQVSVCSNSVIYLSPKKPSRRRTDSLSQLNHELEAWMDTFLLFCNIMSIHTSFRVGAGFGYPWVVTTQASYT